MVQERRDMSLKKRDTEKQTRQLSIDRAQLDLERKRCDAHSEKLAFDKKALLERVKKTNLSMTRAKSEMALQANVGFFV
jgi:hypothetical protein